MNSRPTNGRVANATGLVAFAVTLGVLALAGFAVARLDPGPTGDGSGPALAVLALLGVSVATGLAARWLALVVLSWIRPDGV